MFTSFDFTLWEETDRRFLDVWLTTESDCIPEKHENAWFEKKKDVYKYKCCGNSYIHFRRHFGSQILEKKKKEKHVRVSA